jgi:hypothetical protein
MNNSDLRELVSFLNDYPDPFEFKRMIVDWIMMYDKRPYTGVSSFGMTSDELSYCVQLLSAYSDPIEFREAFRAWLLKKTNELSREFNT